MTFQKCLRYRFAVFECVFVCRFALFASEAIADPVIPFEREANHIRACEGDCGFWNEAASHGDVAHQFTRQSAPSESTGHQ